MLAEVASVPIASLPPHPCHLLVEHESLWPWSPQVLVPKEHSWETRKSVSHSVTFQLQPRWLALRQEMWIRGKSNAHGCPNPVL